MIARPTAHPMTTTADGSGWAVRCFLVRIRITEHATADQARAAFLFGVAPRSFTMKITLPDGSIKEFPAPITARQVAESIGSGLARAAVGAKVDGELVDLDRAIVRDARVAIVTKPRKGTPLGEQSADALYL